ncbi:alpha-1,6-mannosyltransferase [Kibdelosporangium banguiense]|uniref:Alpha-1,6-mannosyltransferase n=1 Tax=Kibdelosporangium banguiense TaxID=1365924 RepID=A0ABS4U344_9PSEU|nr:polyprenol phosphomannose-dependent alpha 1,6 mannosyltransferase MptB [Kibdelosporangium banguiense]MBP2331095.1 alpha-1,6-mannosyltransferase [Kibdelosporangium banguiense]
MSAIAAPVSTRYGLALGLGLAGSAAICAASYLGYNRALFYVGAGLIIWGWLWLRACTRTQILTAIAAWAVPLLAAAPVLSQDLYIYLAQGAIAHAGLDPYTVGPSGLDSPLTAKVSWVWENTPSPYGPLFILLMKSIVAVTGPHLVLAAAITKIVIASGLVLLCAALPGLARHLGGTAEQALWIGAANPLVLVHLVAGAHNDLLMIALLATGTLFVLDRRHLLGIVIVAFAVGIKVTAAIALPFLVWIWAAREKRLGFVKAAGLGAVVTVAVFALCTLAAGVDLGWLKALGGNSLLIHWLSLPTGVGELFGVIPAARIGGWALLAGIIVWLWWRSREGGPKAVAAAAWALLATVLLSAVTMPWYFTWPLVLAAGFAMRPAIVAGVSVWLVVINYPSGDTGLYNWWWVLLTAAAGVFAGWRVTREQA